MTVIQLYRDNGRYVLIEREECEIYRGRRGTNGGPNVHIRSPEDPHFPYPLAPRTDLANHSWTGFEWAYEGPGPAQLALALLARATSNDRLALDLYHEFLAEIVAELDPCGWTLSQESILAWAAPKIRGLQ